MIGKVYVGIDWQDLAQDLIGKVGEDYSDWPSYQVTARGLAFRTIKAEPGGEASVLAFGNVAGVGRWSRVCVGE